MSIFSGLSSGSLLSDEALLHARENYRPQKVVPSAEMAFAQWTERVAVQSDIVVARELAGLTEANLHALASEFEETPQRKRTDLARFAIPVGGVATAAGLVLIFGSKMLAGAGVAELAGLATGGAAALIAGIGLICVGAIQGYKQMEVDVAYGNVGLYVGTLNEQHPWLYKTFQLLKEQAAAQYRDRVLEERGPLRGMDYIMMREIARAHQGLELTQAARKVAEKVQGGKPQGPVAATQDVWGESSESALLAADGDEWSSTVIDPSEFEPPSRAAAS